MGDKFILMDMDDERSKKIAEVIGNKTCKKIIDYLSEVKEASEKDLADKLNIPINTVEYNLVKLVESGLVDKTKNFFWSVKGKKIDMYKLSNKKIVISPKSFSRGIIPALIGIFLLSFGIKVFSDRMNQENVIVNGMRDVSSSVSSGAVNGASSVSASGAIASSVAKAGFVPSAPSVVPGVSNFVSQNCLDNNIWLWFLLGGLSVILIFLLWNQLRKMKGGLK